MNKTNFILASVLTFFTATYTYAEAANVFCTKLDGSDWYWLTNIISSPPTTPEQWEDFHSQVNIDQLKYFDVSADTYFMLNDQCEPPYFAQPAYNQFDYWSSFRVTMPSGLNFSAPNTADGNYFDPRIVLDYHSTIENSQPNLRNVNSYRYKWRPIAAGVNRRN